MAQVCWNTLGVRCFLFGGNTTVVVVVVVVVSTSYVHK